MQRLQFDLGEQISRKEYLRRKRKSSNSLKKRSKITYLLGGCFTLLFIYTVVQLVIYRNNNNFKYTAGDGILDQKIYSIFFVTEGYTYDPVYSVSSIESSGEHETSILPNGGMSEISIMDEYIYGIKDNKLCRSNKKNSNDLEEVIADDVRKYVVSNNDIYYISGDNEQLKRYEIDSSKTTNIDSSNVKEIVVNDRYLFVVVNGGTEKQLYRYSRAGDSKTRIANEASISYFIEDNGYIYFINKKDSNHIYKIKEDGTGLTKISDIIGVSDNGAIKEVDGKKYLFVKDNTIYYVNSADENTLWSFNMGNNEKTKVISAPIELLQNVDDTIFYKIDKDMGVYLYNYNTKFMSLVTKRRVKEFIIDF